MPTPHWKGNSACPLLTSCLLVFGAQKTLATEEMQRNGEDRDTLAETVRIGISPTCLGISKHQREAYT